MDTWFVSTVVGDTAAMNIGVQANPFLEGSSPAP